jgi:hypothetical protein
MNINMQYYVVPAPAPAALHHQDMSSSLEKTYMKMRKATHCSSDDKHGCDDREDESDEAPSNEFVLVRFCYSFVTHEYITC